MPAIGSIRTRLSGLALAVVAVTSLTACGGDGAEVEVQDAGDSDRVAFRLDVEVGHTERQTIELEQTISAAGQTVDVPTTTIVLLTEVTAVEEDRVETDVTYEDVSVADGESSAQIETALAPLEGAGGSIVYAGTGAVLESEIETPAGLDQTSAQVFEQIEDQATSLGVVFPEEEIGEGARWTATSQLSVSGLDVEQTATYTLESLDGDGYTISVELEQEFEPGEVEGVEITSGSGSTTGEFSGTVGLIAPTDATASGTSSITAEQGGATQSITTDVGTTITTELG